MIRAALIALAVLNVWWFATGKTHPDSLAAALIDVAAACVLDLLNTAWHRRSAA